MRNDIRIIRAGADDARAVAEFLQRQDVRPAPSTADVEALTQRDDAALWCAWRRDSIEGVLSCVKDGSVLRLAYFAVAQEQEDLLTGALVRTLEAFAFAIGAALIAAQTRQASHAYRCLMRAGFACDWEEGDAALGRPVTSVDLIKTI